MTQLSAASTAGKAFFSTKTYGHDIGLSCAFRQWRANSHCRLLHGYAIAVKFVFGSRTLDDRNWVVDFGGLKTLKSELEYFFDHTVLVSKDDPELGIFQSMANRNMINLRVVEAVGCEAFSVMAFELARVWLVANGYGDRVWVESAEVREHGANSAIAQHAREAI